MSSFNLYRITYIIILVIGITSVVYGQSVLPGWQTNTKKSLIDLSELKRGGPPKDGIPSIDNPKFVAPEVADDWLSPKEPVIALEVKGEARAYPLQILIWHEIVNDEINEEPVLVTFCPLCYSALVFERTLDGEILEFGVSGFLRHSDLVMYDRKTETLWQQFTGKAIVGDFVGTRLKQIPSQIISYRQFKDNYPEGKILSQETGYNRSYGRNPYTGYDDINNTPLFGTGKRDGRLSPMEKVIGVKLDNQAKTYPYSVSKKEQVINDRIADVDIVVLHLDGARSALDAATISQSREDGSTGVFKRTIDDKVLTFKKQATGIVDEQTGSKWSITGKAVSGPLEGKQLQPVTYGDYFAFAWLVFWPDTPIYGNEK